MYFIKEDVGCNFSCMGTHIVKYTLTGRKRDVLTVISLVCSVTDILEYA